MASNKTKHSPAMAFAVEMARANGGRLHYYPGGFWSGATKPESWPGNYVATGTIQALIKRGIVTVREIRRNSAGSSYPVIVELTEGLE